MIDSTKHSESRRGVSTPAPHPWGYDEIIGFIIGLGIMIVVALIVLPANSFRSTFVPLLLAMITPIIRCHCRINGH